MSTNSHYTKKELLDSLPQVGQLEWIGLRPSKNTPCLTPASAKLELEQGLLGDHYSGSRKKRQLTLIQAEHLAAVALLLGRESIPPGMVRRNLVVSGINLLAFRDRQFWVGDCLLETTGLCHPCSKMERSLGAGGYNAMRGHGGITAKIVEAGTIHLRDKVRLHHS